MSKFLEYILTLKDKISDPLKKVTGVSSDTFNNTKKLTDQVNKLDGSFSKAATGGLTRFNIALGNLYAQGIAKFGGVINEFFSGSVDGYIKREQDIVGLTTFLGDNAKNVYAQIEKDAAATPFGLDALLSANRGLISTGMNADAARQDVLNLSNAVAAVGGNDAVLERMGANLQQIKNIGSATAMDIKQFGFAGINIYALLAKATGKSVDQVKDMTVSYGQLSKALEMANQKGGLYYGASEKQSKTMGGLLSTLRDGFKKFMADTGEAMQPFMEKGIQYIQRFVDATPKILSVLKPIIESVGNIFFYLIDVIGYVIGFFQGWYNKIKEGNWFVLLLTAGIMGIVGAMIIMRSMTLAITAVTLLWEGAQWLINAAMYANPIGIIIALIIAFAAVIAYIIYRYNGWGDAWKNLVNYLSYSWKGFKESFYLIWLYVQDGFLSGVELMQKAWYKFKSLWDEDGANAGLKKLDEQANERAKQIAESKGKLAEYTIMAADSWNKIGLKDNGKGIKDFGNDIKEKLGIAKPSLNGQPVNTNFSSTSGKDASGKSKSETVATGGTKNTTIHINIGKQIERLEVVSNNIKEGAEKIRDIIVDEMSRAIAMSQAIAE